MRTIKLASLLKEGYQIAKNTKGTYNERLKKAQEFLNNNGVNCNEEMAGMFLVNYNMKIQNL